MTLQRPNMLTLEGQPVAGHAPTQIMVMEGTLTPAQTSAVQHAYRLFCLTKQTAVGDFFVMNRRLQGGVRVRMESMQGRDRVMAWASPLPPDDVELLHGFGVVTDWQDPRFYWQPEPPVWRAQGQSPVQLKKSGVTYNHVTYLIAEASPQRWEFYPLVHGVEAKLLWGWAPYRPLELKAEGAVMPDPGFGRTSNAIVPVALTYTVSGKTVRRSRHFAVDDWVLAQNGQQLYAMADVPSMGVDDPVRKLPPCTDATGTQLGLQQWRLFLVSSTFQVYRFRTCSEVLERVGASSYSRVSRDIEEFSTALKLANADFVFGSIEGEVEEPHLQRMGSAGGGVWTIGTVIQTPSGNYVEPDPEWGTDRLAWCVYGVYFYPMGEDETRGLYFDEAGGRRTATGAPSELAEYAKLLAIPQWSGIGHCKMQNRLLYAPEILMEAGSKIARFVANNEDLKNCVGLATHLIYRRRAEHAIDRQPRLTLDFEWTQVDVLEGDVRGQYRAKANEDHRVLKNAYLYLEDEQQPPFRQWYTTADIGAIPAEDPGGGTVGYTRLEAMLGNLVDFEGLREQYPVNGETIIDDSDKEEPSCTGEYTYTSRFVIDFDNRAQFCAAIRVRATCAGARWHQVPGRYMGAMDLDSEAAYTVQIALEVRIGQKTIERVLVEESTIRIPYEFRSIRYDNVLIWPANDTDRELFVYMPPELVPPMQAHLHLQAIAMPQGVNPHVAAHDVPPDGVTIPQDKISRTQLEASVYSDSAQRETPHPRRPTGLLYARTITLGDFIDSALWMLGESHLKIDAARNFNYVTPDTESWYYFPAIKAALGEKVHMEVRGDEFVTWSDDIPPRSGSTRPPQPDRSISLYYV